MQNPELFGFIVSKKFGHPDYLRNLNTFKTIIFLQAKTQIMLTLKLV